MAIPGPRFPTEDQKRGFDCQMLKDKIDFYQLEIFHKHFSKDPATLYTELKTHVRTLNKLRGKILKKDQWELIFPASGLTDSKKFDTTLTFVLIRNLCGYDMPRTGWDQEPDPCDTTEIADSIRLRLARNRIQHGRLELTRQQYRALFRLVEKPLGRIGCPPNDLKQLTPSFKYNIPDATPNFIGRDAELQLIHDTFLGNPKPNGVVIVGIPGIGKSELASQYAQKYAAGYDHIMFINGDSIEASLQDIAKILKLSNETDINVIVKLLEEYFKNEKVLFVYDNVTDTNTLATVFIRDFDNIITTQIQSWGDRYKKVILDVWTNAQAMQYLANSKLNCLEQGALQLLAYELGHHPLAIEHAVSFIGQSPITLQEYLAFLQSDRLRVLSEKVTLNQSGIKTSIFKSFLLTIQKLQTEEHEAFHILSILGILDGSFIHQHLPEELCKDKLQYIRIRQLLVDYSMIKINQHISEWNCVVTEYWTIHSIYQQAAIFILNNQNLISQTFEKCMTCLIYDKEVVGFNFNKNNDQLLHLWKQSSLQNLMIEFFERNSGVLWRIYFLEYKRRAEFRDLFVKIEDKHENNIHNTVLYWAKLLHLTLLFDEDRGDRKRFHQKFLAIRNEINLNIKAGVEKERLISFATLLLQVFNDSSPLVQFLSLIYRGMFAKAREVLGMSEQVNGFCYKETRQYDLALKELFSNIDIGHSYLNPKVHISCCYILKGEVDRGIKLLKSITDFVIDNFVDIGRAFYDAGLYEKTKEYFERFLANIGTEGQNEFNYGHTALDFFYKIMILRDDAEALSQMMKLSCFFYNYQTPNPIIDPSRFRWFLFQTCMLIKTDRVLESFCQVHAFIETHKAPNIFPDFHREICFRDVFFLASQWKMQGYFYKSLMVYRIVEMIRREFNDVPELFLHDYNDVDVTKEIELCSKNLKQIFSKFFK